MKIKAVIADDEYFIRARLAKVINDNRTNIEIMALCEDGEDIIKILLSNDIDILIMDIRMINVGGLEVAKYIYDNKINTKTIIISGYNDFDYAIEAMRYGVFDYLTKPLAEDELLRAIDKCILHIYNLKNNIYKCDVKESLLVFFKDKDYNEKARDMSEVRAVSTKYFNNSDKQGIKEYIINNTEDIIENYNYISLYKFIREIVASLDIKYNILKNNTLSYYIDDLILSKKFQNIDELNNILINLSIDCMSLNTSSTNEQNLCKAIFEDIEKHFNESDYCVSKMAENLNKNSSYLNSIFKKNHGYTIIQALNNYRLERARRLLKNSNTKISEIAKSCGYIDTFYFSKKFKSKFGYPPSEEILKL